MTQTVRHLARDPSFRADQATIALFVAQLDDQTRRLRRAVDGLTPDALSWHPGPGRNSVGMLLVHIALTEVFWISVAAGAATDRDAAERVVREVSGLGLDDDGMPAPPHGGHPAVLSGWDVARYAGALDVARRHLRTVVSGWTDADLADAATWRDTRVTREWVLYHLLEHYAQHAGQVGLVLALRGRPA